MVTIVFSSLKYINKCTMVTYESESWICEMYMRFGCNIFHCIFVSSIDVENKLMKEYFTFPPLGVYPPMFTCNFKIKPNLRKTSHDKLSTSMECATLYLSITDHLFVV